MREQDEITSVGVIKSERRVLDTPFFPVVERVIETPDGTVREPQFVWDKQGKEFSVAIALTPDQQLILITEPKYGQMRDFLVVPTGGVKKNESSYEAAIRELREESGYTTREWVVLKSGIVDSPDKSDGGEHSIFLGLNAICQAPLSVDTHSSSSFKGGF